MAKKNKHYQRILARVQKQQRKANQKRKAKISERKLRYIDNFENKESVSKREWEKFKQYISDEKPEVWEALHRLRAIDDSDMFVEGSADIQKFLDYNSTEQLRKLASMNVTEIMNIINEADNMSGAENGMNLLRGFEG